MKTTENVFDFKIGDSIEIIESKEHPKRIKAGMKGKVVEISKLWANQYEGKETIPVLGIEFKTQILNSLDSSCNGNGKPGYCWYVDPALNVIAII
jgi:hypothetical protein